MPVINVDDFPVQITSRRLRKQLVNLHLVPLQPLRGLASAHWISKIIPPRYHCRQLWAIPGDKAWQCPPTADISPQTGGQSSPAQRWQEFRQPREWQSNMFYLIGWFVQNWLYSYRVQVRLFVHRVRVTWHKAQHMEGKTTSVCPHSLHKHNTDDPTVSQQATVVIAAVGSTISHPISTALVNHTGSLASCTRGKRHRMACLKRIISVENAPKAIIFVPSLFGFDHAFVSCVMSNKKCTQKTMGYVWVEKTSRRHSTNTGLTRWGPQKCYTYKNYYTQCMHNTHPALDIWPMVTGTSQPPEKMQSWVITRLHCCAPPVAWLGLHNLFKFCPNEQR